MHTDRRKQPIARATVAVSVSHRLKAQTCANEDWGDAQADGYGGAGKA